MKITFLTIFPEQIEEHFKYGIFRIAQNLSLVQLEVRNMREWAKGAHKSVDDTPYGGGAGMVLRVDILGRAIEELRGENTKVIAMSAPGRRLDQSYLRELSGDPSDKEYIILCGHYEGFDQRILDKYVDIEISVGDYVLSGGELPALLLADGIVRLIPGVLGNEQSDKQESFEDGLLEYPQYTRPADYMGMQVPEILLGGNHAAIEQWRKEASLQRTKERRPDLLS